MEKGGLIWVRNTALRDKAVEDFWLPGEVLDIDVSSSPHTHTWTIKCLDAVRTVSLPSGVTETDDLKPRNTVVKVDMENLIDLPHLNEPEILVSLKERFEKSLIFTYTGRVLLTINPMNAITPSPQCHQMMLRFVENVRRGVTREITENPENPSKHSILIGGESGSGKTETLKMILKAFRRHHAKDPSIAGWFDKLLVCNRVLESFGNARTATTPNSSRFAKMIELFFNPAGDLVGSSIRTYLLESSRTSSQQSGERNFNVFYELLAGLSQEEQAALKIKPRQDYRYTTLGKTDEDEDDEDRMEEKTNDARNFAEFKRNLEILGFAPATIQELFRLVAAVLALGDIQFQDDHSDNAGGCLVVEDEHYAPATVAAELLGISAETLTVLITRKNISTGRGEILNRRLSTAQAVISRDAVARAIYKNIFQWLGSAINAKLNKLGADNESNLESEDGSEKRDMREEKKKNSVMLLDIFGFDSFATNSLEQLCINYANETLQQVFNYHVFKMERELYEREQIQFDELSYPDNTSNIELIDSLVFKILDDQCRIPNPTDKRFLAQVYRDCSGHPRFAGSSAQELQSKFSINHFAGKVAYDATNFIVKNIDNLPQDTARVLSESANALLVQIWVGGEGGEISLASSETLSTRLATPRNAIASTNNTANNNNINDKKKRRQSLAVGASGAGTMRNPPSFVAQVKSDLALLSAEVEPTIPHYVRCIKPCENRGGQQGDLSPTNSSFDLHSVAPFSPSVSLASNTSTPSSALLRRARSRDQMVLFQQWKVSEQLRYSGVLESIRSLKVGFKAKLPHAEFYNKYHVIASQLNDPALFFGPNRVDQSFTDEEVKNLCVALLEALGSPSARSLLENARSKLRIMYIKPSSFDVFARGESGTGLVDSKGIKMGVTLVFILRREHEVLEALRHLALSRCAALVQRQVRRFQAQKYRVKLREACLLLFRAGRLFAAQIRLKHLRMRLRAVFSLQRLFRRRRIIKCIVQIQSLFRRFRANQISQTLKDQRAELLELYGPMITSRAMRNRRRKDYEFYVSDNLPRSLLSADARGKRYDEQESSLIRSIFDLISPAAMPASVLYQHMDYRVLVNTLTQFLSLKNNRILQENEALREKYEYILAHMRRAEHMVKPSSLTRWTIVGKIFGPSTWLAFSKQRAVAQSDKLEVSLHETHSFFLRIVELFPYIDEAKALQKEVLVKTEEERTRLAASSDLLVENNMIDVNTRISAMKRMIQTLDNISLYYRKFIDYFLKEYGPQSAFRAKFSQDVDYARALIALAKQMKEYDGRIDRKDKPSARVYNTQSCPLVVEWKDASSTAAPAVAATPSADMGVGGELIEKMAMLQRKRATFSRDNLRIISHNNIGYKYMPHAPGVEFAMNSLFALLGGQQITARRLIKVSDAKSSTGLTRVAYYQAMYRATNRSLLDVLYDPLLVEQMDTSTMSAAVIACCIAGLTNLQPNNLLVSMDKLDSLIPDGNEKSEKDSEKEREKEKAAKDAPKSMKTIRSVRSLRNMRTISIKPGTDSDCIIRLLAFNNDASLSRSFLDFANPARKDMHAENLNLLFLLPFMDEPVDPDLRKILTATPFKAEEIVTSWLRDCYEQNQRFNALKDAGFKTSDLTALSLPISLSAGAAREVFSRLQRLCHLLSLPHPQAEELVKQGKYQHHIKLHHVLRELYPQMAEGYARVRQQNDFTEGLDFSGVVSYALVYHETLEREARREKEGLTAQTPINKSDADQSGRKSLHQALLLNSATPFLHQHLRETSTHVSTSSAAAATAAAHRSLLRSWKYDRFGNVVRGNVDACDSHDAEEGDGNTASNATDSLYSLSMDSSIKDEPSLFLSVFPDKHSLSHSEREAGRELGGIAVGDDDDVSSSPTLLSRHLPQLPPHSLHTPQSTRQTSQTQESAESEAHSLSLSASTAESAVRSPFTFDVSPLPVSSSDDEFTRTHAEKERALRPESGNAVKDSDKEEEGGQTELLKDKLRALICFDEEARATAAEREKNKPIAAATTGFKAVETESEAEEEGEIEREENDSLLAACISPPLSSPALSLPLSGKKSSPPVLALSSRERLPQLPRRIPSAFGDKYNAFSSSSMDESDHSSASASLTHTSSSGKRNTRSLTTHIMMGERTTEQQRHTTEREKTTSPAVVRDQSVKFNFDNLYGSFRHDENDNNTLQIDLPVAALSPSSSNSNGNTPTFRMVERKSLVCSPTSNNMTHNINKNSIYHDSPKEEEETGETAEERETEDDHDAFKLDLDDLYGTRRRTQPSRDRDRDRKREGERDGRTRKSSAEDDDVFVFEASELRNKLLGRADPSLSSLPAETNSNSNNNSNRNSHTNTSNNGDTASEKASQRNSVRKSVRERPFKDRNSNSISNREEEKHDLATRLRTRASPLDTSIVEEADALLKSFDWRNFEPDEDDFPAARAMEFCQALGKNLSFLPEMWLNHVAEWQLKAMFNHWTQLLRENANSTNVRVNANTRIPLLTRKITLRYDSLDEMDAMRRATILMRLRHRLNIEIRYAIPVEVSEFEQRKQERERRRKERERENDGEDFSFEHKDLQHSSSSHSSYYDDEDSVVPPIIDLEHCSEFDIFEFDSAMPAELFNGEEEDDDDCSEAQRVMRTQLLEVLRSCASLADEKTFAEERAVTQSVIVRMCTGPVQDLDDELMQNFLAVVLQHPGIAPVAQVLADMGGFERYPSFVHKLLKHESLEKCTDLVMHIVRQHPNVLWLADRERNLLPCDLVKALPETAHFKYKLLARLVNFAGDLPVTYVKKYQNAQNQGSVVTSFTGEEELIIRAAHYGIYATENELKTKRFDASKRGFDSTASYDLVQRGEAAMDEDLLWRLLIFEAAGVPQQREYAWQTYGAFIKAMKNRLRGHPANLPGSMSLQEIEDLIWDGLAWESKSETRKSLNCLSDEKVVHSSFIFKDLKANWARGNAKKKALAAALNAKAQTAPAGSGP